MQSAHTQIKESLLSKYGSFNTAFRSINGGDGLITRGEFEAMLHNLNLGGLRPAVVTCLLEMMDYDDDDDGEGDVDIKYEEFVRFLTVDRVEKLFPDAGERDHKLGFRMAPKAAPVVQKAVVKKVEAPVTPQELFTAHTLLKEQILMKHGARELLAPSVLCEGTWPPG